MEEKDYGSASTHRVHTQWRTLSAHELTMLFRLSDASTEKNAVTPEVIALQKAGLVHLVTPENGDATCVLTVDGKVLLRLLRAEATVPH